MVSQGHIDKKKTVKVFWYSEWMQQAKNEIESEAEPQVKMQKSKAQTFV